MFVTLPKMPHTILGSYGGPWFEVTTEEQAALLCSARAVRHLEPFMGRTLGIAEAAREAGVSTEGMMYRVRQFIGVGLLHQIGARARRGRSVTLYRAPAAIRIPFHLTPFDDLKAQLAYQGQVFEELRVRASARALRDGECQARLLYRNDESGTVNSETELADPSFRDRRIGGDFIGTLWLPENVARHLHQQFNDLISTLNQYSQPQENTRPYLLVSLLLGLDPDEDAKWLGPPG